MSRRLWDRVGVYILPTSVLSARNSSMHGPGTFHSSRRYLSGGSPFTKGRRLLPCDDFFLSMCLFWKPSYYIVQLYCYNQVFTEVLPYHGSNVKDMITSIRAGKRPSRPIDPGQSRWLQDPVWDVITTGWHDQPKQRCELSVMYHTFSSSSQQEVRNFKSDDSSVQNEGNLTVAGTPQKPKRQLGKILPRIASFFQFPQNSESEIQRQINEVDEVSSSTSPPLLLKADTARSVSRTTPCLIRSD